MTTHTETGDCPACAPLYAAIDADGGGGGSPYERVENLHERALASQRAARAEPGRDWPSLDELRRMGAAEVNAFFESHGIEWRVVDRAEPGLPDGTREFVAFAVELLDAWGKNPETVVVGRRILAALEAHGEPPRDHPFKDEWSFQRRMSKGNPVAGQPIAPDQPCFTCGVAFSAHGEPQEGKR